MHGTSTPRILERRTWSVHDGFRVRSGLFLFICHPQSCLLWSHLEDRLTGQAGDEIRRVAVDDVYNSTDSRTVTAVEKF